jgi:YbgC/YbaW family acyl-CoA thioester hydrolase
MSDVFSIRLAVRFGDCDPAGIVYYPVFFHYFHVALEEFFAARCGIAYHKLMSDERLGFPTVKTEAEFFAPLRYGDEFAVSVAVSQTGRSSATFVYSLTRGGELCARSRNVHVCTNLDTMRAVPLPEKYRAALAANGAREAML